jgi:serine/threonine protein phosphatase PrpC
MIQTFQATCQGATSVANSDASAVIGCGDRVLAVVCDGVSSAPRGGDAARLTVQAVMDACQHQEDWSDPLGLAEDWVLTAHASVAARFGHSGLCTLVLAIVGKDRLWGVHVGDSTCVIVGRGGGTNRLTEPHRRGVLRRLNGQPVVLHGMPVFDQFITRVVGQSEPLVLDGFEHALAHGDWVACFTDGVEEERVEGYVRHGQVTREGVKLLVEQCARSTDDDATLVLIQSAETIDWDSLLSRLADYARLDAEQREHLIDRLQDAPLPGAGAEAGVGLRQAYAAEVTDGRAARLARLVLAAARPDHRTVEQMLDQALLRRQTLTARALKTALSAWG